MKQRGCPIQACCWLEWGGCCALKPRAVNGFTRSWEIGEQLPVSNTIAAVSPFLVGMVYDAQGTYAPAFMALAAFSVLTAVLLFFASPPARSSLTASHPGRYVPTF
jgi:hypothetical protein